MAEKSAEPNHEKHAERMTKCVNRSMGRVTKERYVPGWSNKEVEGHMAGGAMLTRRPPWATGSWTSTGNGRTCAPILSDWLDKAGENAVHAEDPDYRRLGTGCTASGSSGREVR